MHIIYEGIELEALEITDFVQEAVYDDTKTDWLYDRYYIRGRFLVNGQEEVNIFTPTTSYDINTKASETLRQLWQRTSPDGARAGLPLAGGPPGVNNPTYGRVRSEQGPFAVQPGDGVYATSTQNQAVDFVFKRTVPCVNTHLAIRDRLNNPRGRLFVFTGRGDPGRKDEMLLMAPSDWNSHCDCKNGPVPQYVRVSPFHGDARTFVVEWAVETFLRTTSATIIDESPNAKNTPTTSPLLSNRFSCHHVIDPDSYLTIETTGTAIFRADFMYRNAPLNPDQMRLNVCLPVPFGMVREVVSIDALPDGTGFNYVLRDRQQHANFVAGPYANATEIDAVHRQAILLDEDAITGALHAYERVYRLRADRNFSRDAEAKSKPLAP